MSRSTATALTLRCGPWKGVRDTLDPFDDSPDYLVDAQNCYIPDPAGASDLYARPGCELCNSGSQLGSGSFNGTGMYTHTAYDGTRYNFVADGGKLYRLSADLLTQTDVTPVNIPSLTLSNATGARVFFASFNDALIVSDGHSKPWYVTSANLSATPLVAIPIEYETVTVLLSRGTDDTKLASTAFNYAIAGVPHSKAAVPVGTALPVGTLALNLWASYRVSINAAGTITLSGAPNNYSPGYASEALALAALPAVPASSWNMGSFTVQAPAGSAWAAGTDALAGGTSGTPARTTNYYAGEAPPWSAQHLTIYGGALFFLANLLNGENAQSTLVWSEIGDQTTGYHQDGFDYVWSLIQTASTPLYAIWGTNLSLYYWRDQTIGVIAGPVGPNLQSTATHDAAAYNSGTRSPATIAQFGDSLFYADTQGRPMRLAPGQPPTPIWLNLRAVVDAAQTGFPVVTSYTAIGVVEPTLNLYVVALWSPDPTAVSRPTTAAVFDVKTGTYVGSWTIGPGISIASIGILMDANANPELVVLGSKIASQASNAGGYLWRLRSLAEAVWTDNGAVPTITATSQRLGYSADTVLHADQATIVTGSDAPCTVTVVATGTPSTLEGTPSPAPSQDETYRLVCGLDAFGRGVELTVSPTTATSQWSLAQIVMRASRFRAGPEDA